MSPRRSKTTTVWSDANRAAIAPPIAPDPPVTTATRRSALALSNIGGRPPLGLVRSLAASAAHAPSHDKHPHPGPSHKSFPHPPQAHGIGSAIYRWGSAVTMATP